MRSAKWKPKCSLQISYNIQFSHSWWWCSVFTSMFCVMYDFWWIVVFIFIRIFAICFLSFPHKKNWFNVSHWIWNLNAFAGNPSLYIFTRNETIILCILCHSECLNRKGGFKGGFRIIQIQIYMVDECLTELMDHNASEFWMENVHIETASKPFPNL